MELTPISYENTGPGLTESLRERRMREARGESKVISSVAGDTVSISDEAREKLKTGNAAEIADNKQPGLTGEQAGAETEETTETKEQDWREAVQAKKQQEQGLSGDLTFVDPAAGGGSVQAKTVDEEKIAALRKQIQEVQRQLNKEQQNLQKAQSKQESESAQSDSDTGPDAPAQGEDLPELKAAQEKVGQLTDQLLQLNQQLQDAMGGGGGGSGGGQIQGTRAGSGGVGRIMAHVGRANDPYAAAAAAEAAEMGASQPLSF